MLAIKMHQYGSDGGVREFCLDFDIPEVDFKKQTKDIPMISSNM